MSHSQPEKEGFLRESRNNCVGAQSWTELTKSPDNEEPSPSERIDNNDRVEMDSNVLIYKTNKRQSEKEVVNLGGTEENVEDTITEKECLESLFEVEGYDSEIDEDPAPESDDDSDVLLVEQSKDLAGFKVMMDRHPLVIFIDSCASRTWSDCW